MKTIELTPHAPSLMESTRAIGYSIEAAVADIIDNSIAARASKIDIDFFPLDAYISILDNGSGMKHDELIEAMRYGSTNPLDERDSEDLGRYGLGLKTASLSQCRKLTVVTKQQSNLFAARWDLDYVSQTGKWSLLILTDEQIDLLPNIEKLQQYNNGTIVIWEELDKFSVGERDITSAFNNKIGAVREHLSLVFHRFLSGETGIKKIEIRMNGLEVKPHDPFLRNKSTQLMDNEVIQIRGSEITVCPYILPHTSKLTKEELDELGGEEGLRKKQGFYVYRNRRLLVWGTWFRLLRQGDLSKLARVKVDIPNSLDELWTLDIKKSKAIPPDEVRSNLANIVKKISDGSKRTWTYRGKKEVDDNETCLWNRLINRNGGISYEVNMDHPLIKDLGIQDPRIERRVTNLLKNIGLALPLNSLYVDLTNDEKIINDSEENVKEVVALFKDIITSADSNRREAMMKELLHTDPFVTFADEIKAEVEGENKSE